MKIIKYLLLLFLILIIAGSIFIATKGGEYQVQESRLINAPAPLLFHEVNDFSTWQEWTHWGSEEDIIVNVEESNSGDPTGIIWENSDMGDGSIRTRETIPNTSIDQVLILESSISDIQQESYWKFEPATGGTKVTWGIKDDLNFKEKLALTLRGGDLEEDFSPKLQRGLAALEEKVQRQMEEYSINVDGVTQHGGGFYMYMTTAAKTEEVYERGAEMIRQVNLYMRSNNISINGKPFILYNQRDEQSRTAIFSAAVPTPSQVITPSGSTVLNGFLPAQKTVKTTLKGNFKNAPEAWQTAFRYIEENELEINSNAAPFEVYFTDPAEEENPALWITEIYIPVL